MLSILSNRQFVTIQCWSMFSIFSSYRPFCIPSFLHCFTVQYDILLYTRFLCCAIFIAPWILHMHTVGFYWTVTYISLYVWKLYPEVSMHCTVCTVRNLLAQGTVQQGFLHYCSVLYSTYSTVQYRTVLCGNYPIIKFPDVYATGVTRLSTVVL